MLKIAVLLFCVAVVHGATFARRAFFPGNERLLRNEPVCPGLRRTGEVWQTQGKCDRCTCHPSGEVTCDTCGVTPDRTGMCYQQASTYPRCCIRICFGDRDFDILQYYNNGARF